MVVDLHLLGRRLEGCRREEIGTLVRYLIERRMEGWMIPSLDTLVIVVFSIINTSDPYMA